MKKILLIPVWLLVWPFTFGQSGTHIFRHWDMSLKGWTRHGTSTAVCFGAFFWISLICIVSVLLYLKTHTLPN